jgi:pSer/pThr/pTyr-binding forkhead associated (FHA) protein
VCAACGAELTGRFCESCGHDALAPVVPASAVAAARPVTWHAVVRADRDWFDQVRTQKGADAAGLEFPRYAVERRFVLTGPQVAIGRRDTARGTTPDIDLNGLDPGVSAAHAVLLARADGGWELVDVGSTNGTSVGDGPIPAQRAVPLVDGTVVRLGAWTTITISAG